MQNMADAIEKKKMTLGKSIWIKPVIIDIDGSAEDIEGGGLGFTEGLGLSSTS